jgi:hypothetical protein
MLNLLLRPRTKSRDRVHLHAAPIRCHDDGVFTITTTPLTIITRIRFCRGGRAPTESRAARFCLRILGSNTRRQQREKAKLR